MVAEGLGVDGSNIQMPAIPLSKLNSQAAEQYNSRLLQISTM